ncbi:MAG: glucose-6-phosphate isomerase [Pseudomonadota bacterium]
MSNNTNARHEAWDVVRRAHASLGPATLRTLFDQHSNRFETFSRTGADILFDFSKQRLDTKALKALIDLSRASDVEWARDQMVSGAAINITENRAVRHMALRASPTDPAFADVADDVDAVREAMLAFAEGVRSGKVAAADDGPLKHVINIGIGGSDLGPQLAVQALQPDNDGPAVHFVSNVDGAHIADTLAKCEPARTLVLVASKSFATLETLRNAKTARAWLVNACGEEAVADHFAALSTNLEAVAAFGIRSDRTFGFWDWVGGRYSLWSVIGLPVAIAIGPEKFRELLSGAAAMDAHFLNAPLGENLPVLAALVGIWNRNIEGHAALGILPYDQRLQRLPAYVQQLDMESNGKSVALDGSALETVSGPIVWGEPGTNAQHAFFQMLHQGATIVPCDFLVAADSRETEALYEPHHKALVANCLAQSEALALGETTDEARARMEAAGMATAEIERLGPHKTFPGNRPSSTLLYPALTPALLGQLLAFYEHKVFVQGVIWGINSFDQWGVQLGKLLADELTPMLSTDEIDPDRNGSTNGLLQAVRHMRNR